MHFLRKSLLAASFLLAAGSAFAQQNGTYEPTQENLKAREEFQDMKFGIFPLGYLQYDGPR